MSLTLTRNLPTAPRIGWTVEEFEGLFDAGFIAPDARLELIEGENFEKEAREPKVAVAISLAQEVLRRIFENEF